MAQEKLSRFPKMDIGPPEALFSVNVNEQPSDEDNAMFYFGMGYNFQIEGQSDRALACYHNVLKYRPDLVEVYYNIGIIFQDRGYIDVAIAAYQKALALDPEHAESFLNMGTVLQDQGKFSEAIACYNMVLKAKPDHAKAYNNLGNAFEKQGKLESAIACYQKALDLQPDFPDACYNLGNALRDLGRISAAIESFRTAIQLRDDYYEAYNNLGNLMRDQDHLEAAIENYRHALKIKSDFPEAYYNLANALHQLGQLDAAIDSFRQALRLKPNFSRAHTNLANVYKELGHFKTALQHYDQALAIKPDLAEANFNRSVLSLLHQNYVQGWKGFEWRFKQSNWKTIYPFRIMAPRWDGLCFKGRRLFVHCEQGLGDTLQFIRYLPMVKARGGTLIFETRRPLIGLLKSFPAIDLLIERSPDGNPAVAFDFYLPLMSIPAILQTTFDMIPADVPYLFAKDSMVNKWQKRISSQETKLKVGIVWAGKPGHTNDHKRSCDLKLFEPLSEIPGVQLYSLQKGEAMAQLKQFPDNYAIVNLGEEFIDFEDTAGAVENLDLIVSVDTAVAHLAAAMGKPTWVLLPFVPDWRWLKDRNDSPWYPSIRLFRQPKIGDWYSVFQSVAVSIKKIL